ncbi:isoamyl alcohol oxidase [Apiospora phragmitis]|uniref:Isoamyl alcohol oxidase n=1 Tax=Apiospora phragmitis TaxID=2905665 RepID=A0ABR1VUV6_9PEZI
MAITDQDSSPDGGLDFHCCPFRGRVDSDVAATSAAVLPVLPGDDCWPSPEEWNDFNETISGGLIATVPIASPCHDSFPGVEYDAEKCADIQANWARPSFHFATAHSPMTSFFANLSCDPFTPRDTPCIGGAYVSYAVNASGVSNYRETVPSPTT